MRIIDLLNKIANGEEVPKKIKWRDKIWTYNNYKQDYEINDTDLLGYGFYNHRTLDFINDEIEIIEEEKKIPEKLNIEDDGNAITLFGEKENEWTILDNVDVIICNKINSIIDYLKSKGE